MLTALPLQYQSIIYPTVASIIAGKPVTKMVYNMLQKPGIYQGSRETVGDFLKRMPITIIDNPGKFLFREEVRIGAKRQAVMLENVAACCTELDALMTHGKLAQWYRQPTSCTQFGAACEYMPLCLRGEQADVMTLYATKED